jgi:hypothetical protein
MGGSSKGFQHTSQDISTNVNNIPSFMRGFYDDSLKLAQAESKVKYNPYAGGDASARVAGFNPAQTAVFNEVGAMKTPEEFNQASNMYSNMGNMGASAAMQGLGGAGITQGMGINQAAMGANRAFGAADALGQRGQSAVDQGMRRAFADSTPQTFGADQAKQYTNPYQQNVTDIALRQAREESIRQGNLANLSAAGRGTAGGTRQAVMDSMRNRDTATGLSDIQMQGSMRGYENAQQQFERDQGRRMGSAKLGATMAGQGFGAMGQAGGQYGSLTGQGYSAAGQANQLLGQTGMQGLGTGAAGLSAVGTAEQNANLARLGAQNRVGSQMQDQDKKVIDADIAQYYEKLGYNKDQISWFINQMKTAPVQLSSQTNSGYGRPTSFGQQATGLAAAGIGAFT